MGLTSVPARTLSGETDDGGFGDAVDLGRSTTAYTVGPDDAKLQSTWAHNLGDGLADAPENIYAVVTADGRQVTPEDGAYSTDDFNVILISFCL